MTYHFGAFPLNPLPSRLTRQTWFYMLSLLGMRLDAGSSMYWNMGYSNQEKTMHLSGPEKTTIQLYEKSNLNRNKRKPCIYNFIHLFI